MQDSPLQLEKPKGNQGLAFLELGFRPFFLLASAYAALAVALWAGVYFRNGVQLSPGLSPNYWHGHEMVFGYGLAVVAGFLLTAIKNWTGIQTLRGAGLALLAVTWLAARMAFVLQLPWLVTLTLEMLFFLGLLFATARPLYQAHQWRNLSIFCGKLVLLGIGNLLFYLGMAGILEQGMRWGLYTGLYLLLALVFTMGRRVIPFFIEKGVDYPVSIRNSRLLDLTSLMGLLGLWLAELVVPASVWTAGFALLTAGAQIARLYWWHTPGIWRKPLLWSLWLGLAFVTLGLLLKAVADWKGLTAFAAWHAIAYGGIGLVTLSMMARATLGHTGRNVFAPPRGTGLLFFALAIGALLRSLGPLLLPGHYLFIIGLTQMIWILVFGLFFVFYLPFWWGPAAKGAVGR